MASATLGYNEAGFVQIFGDVSAAVHQFDAVRYVAVACLVRPYSLTILARAPESSCMFLPVDVRGDGSVPGVPPRGAECMDVSVACRLEPTIAARLTHLHLPAHGRPSQPFSIS